MKYCSYCGKQIMDQAVVCPNCGCAQGGKGYIEHRPSTGLNIVGFLWPLIGLILYLVYEGKAPNKAKAIGKWSLWGLIVPIIVLFGFVFIGYLISAIAMA